MTNREKAEKIAKVLNVLGDPYSNDRDDPEVMRYVQIGLDCYRELRKYDFQKAGRESTVRVIEAILGETQ